MRRTPLRTILHNLWYTAHRDSFYTSNIPLVTTEHIQPCKNLCCKLAGCHSEYKSHWRSLYTHC